MTNSAVAFGGPTAVAPIVLPPNVRWMNTYAQGLLFSLVRSSPQGIGYGERTTWQKGVTDAVAFVPYILTFGFQAHAQTHNWFPKVADAVSEGWATFCRTLPAAIRGQALKYPIHFVLARLAAQLAGAAGGAVLSSAWMSQFHDVQLQRNSEDGKGNAPSMSKETAAATFAMFSVPAAMSTPAGMKFMNKKLGLGPVPIATIVVTAVVSAMWGVAQVAHQTQPVNAAKREAGETFGHKASGNDPVSADPQAKREL